MNPIENLKEELGLYPGCGKTMLTELVKTTLITWIPILGLLFIYNLLK